MQFKIPQDVQIEDKIVGPLTLRQLIYLGIGGGITYAIYVVLARDYFIEVWLVPTLVPGLLTLAVTFLKIKGIPFAKWVLLMLEYLWNPRQRTFIMGGADMYSQTIFAKNKKKEETKIKQASKAEEDREKIQKLNEITKLLDSYGKPSNSTS
jgi:hypothetical protein